MNSFGSHRETVHVAPRLRPDIPSHFNELNAIETHWDRILASFNGSIPPPYEVLIHPSSTCNLACDWCIGEFVPTMPLPGRFISISSKTSPSRLPDTLANPEVMSRLVDEIASYKTCVTVPSNSGSRTQEFRVEAISFSGLIGEPLVAKAAVCAAIDRIAQKMRVGLFTNGTLIDEGTAERLQNAAYVLISLDAASPETYARLKYAGRHHGKTMFEKAVNGITLLNKLRNSSSTLEVNASFIACRQNVHELYAAAKLAKNLGVRYFRLKQDNSGEMGLDNASISIAMSQITRIESELTDSDFSLVRIHRDLTQPELQRSFHRCGITDIVAALGSDGHLYPCNYHPRPNGLSYGDAATNGFRAIWEGEQRLRLRRSLPDACPPTCDPFKGRANHLLEPLRNNFEAAGAEAATTSLATLSHTLKQLKSRNSDATD